MSSEETTVSVANVRKVYETYRKPSHRLIQFFLKKKRLYQEFVALNDVSLEVYRGETLGIVGKNGSGKSTLLQILAGTLTPTSGEASCRGRVLAILELGAGFNREFTGMENVRLNASIMGMGRREVDERIPEIVAFSELGDFVNKPVKTYSSGMYVRLAFSVVVSMQPDVLIVDEALAVGDSGFQRKCFRKLDELRDNGVTILFVTHATDTVVSHCDRAMFLENGEVRCIGEPKTVVNEYLESLFHKPEVEADRTYDSRPDTVQSRTLNMDPEVDGCLQRVSYNDTEYRWGSRAARILDYRVLDEEGEELGMVCNSGSRITVPVVVYFAQAFDNLVYGLTIKTVDGVNVFGTNTERIGALHSSAAADTVTQVVFEVELRLVSGEYFFSIGVISRGAGAEVIVLDRRYDLFRLNIEDDGRALGYAALPFSVTLDHDVLSDGAGQN